MNAKVPGGFLLIGIAVLSVHSHAEKLPDDGDFAGLDTRLAKTRRSPSLKRQRIQKEVNCLIAKLAKESLEDSTANLASYGDYPLELLRTGLPPESLHSGVALGSRRYSRLEELLDALPSDRRHIRRAFDEMMREGRETVDRIITYQKTRIRPKKTRPVLADVLGLSCALFLGARHGDVRLVCEGIRLVRALTREAVKMAQEKPLPPHLSAFFAREMALPSDVEGNAIVMAVMQTIKLSRRESLSEEDVSSLLALRTAVMKAVDGLTYQEAVVVVWDAAVVETDRLHLPAPVGMGLPVTEAGEKVSLYRGFSKQLVDQLVQAISAAGLLE